MNCPYCKNEMTPGYIPNGGQPVQWLPEGRRPSPFSFTVAEAGVPLRNTFSPWKANGYKAAAYYCKGCGIVLAPVAAEGR